MKSETITYPERSYVAGWTRALGSVGRLQSWWAAYCLGKLWQLGEGVVASLAGHAEYVYSVAFSPNGQHIVSGSGASDKLVKLWSVSARKGGCVAGSARDCVCSVALSPDGQHIVSGSEDKLVKVWSVSERCCDALCLNTKIWLVVWQSSSWFF